jgi:DNA-binding CsgD family transcriptional regulator
MGSTLRATLPSAWRRLHRAGQLLGGAVVGPDDVDGTQIVGFGMSVFVEDSFVSDCLAAPTPYASARVYELIADGRSPVVPTRDMPAANSCADLNLLILHFGIRHPDPNDDRWRGIVVAAHAGFQLCHVGYRVKRVLQEVYGDELPVCTAGGFLLKSDYQAYFSQRGRQVPADTERPYLMGLFRDDPESNYPGSALSYLFQHLEPRFHFSPAEQRVLLLAITDEPDATIADVLGISRDAVKQTWRRIHDRMDTVAPRWSAGLKESDHRRRKDRRRPLIQYLRYHLEELRPFRKPTLKAAGGSERG